MFSFKTKYRSQLDILKINNHTNLILLKKISLFVNFPKYPQFETESYIKSTWRAVVILNKCGDVMFRKFSTTLTFWFSLSVALHFR